MNTLSKRSAASDVGRGGARTRFPMKIRSLYVGQSRIPVNRDRSISSDKLATGYAIADREVLKAFANPVWTEGRE